MSAAAASLEAAALVPATNEPPSNALVNPMLTDMYQVRSDSKSRSAVAANGGRCGGRRRWRQHHSQFDRRTWLDCPGCAAASSVSHGMWWGTAEGGLRAAVCPLHVTRAHGRQS
jgi:hypothetical protein